MIGANWLMRAPTRSRTLPPGLLKYSADKRRLTTPETVYFPSTDSSTMLSAVDLTIDSLLLHCDANPEGVSSSAQ
jgi:hypothetical protein